MTRCQQSSASTSSAATNACGAGRAVRSTGSSTGSNTSGTVPSTLPCQVSTVQLQQQRMGDSSRSSSIARCVRPSCNLCSAAGMVFYATWLTVTTGKRVCPQCMVADSPGNVHRLSLINARAAFLRKAVPSHCTTNMHAPPLRRGGSCPTRCRWSAGGQAAFAEGAAHVW